MFLQLALYLSRASLWLSIRIMQPLDVWTSLWLCMAWSSARAHHQEDWVSSSALQEDLAQTPLLCDCTPQYLQHKPTDFRMEKGEGVGEQTNVYKLQSYSIYKAQTEPEPWGTQDGNNLQSRFAWSYAAFERSDSAGGAGRGPGGDAGLHLCDRYHPCYPHHPPCPCSYQGDIPTTGD